MRPRRSYSAFPMLATMSALERLVRERTELTAANLDRLTALTSEWSLISDLALSDLVLWLPTWNDGGFVAGAHVRPATAPTTIPQDIVGSFVARTRSRVLDRSVTLRATIAERDARAPLVPAEVEAVPIVHDDNIIAVIERRASVGSRPIGRLETVYLQSADDLLAMVQHGQFPDLEFISETEAPPRAGDGLVRLDSKGKVIFASPNAQSAYHRLGLAVDIEGSQLAAMTTKLAHRPGPVDEAVAVVASGRAAGGVEVDNGVATLTLRSLPLQRDGESIGALVLVRDVTDLRRRERALLTKDATIREVHHRVKNNLQTVAALLRLQARRSDHPDAKEALNEAVRRVAAIGIVHETLATTGASDESVHFDSIIDRLLGQVREFFPSSALTLERRGSAGELSTRVATPLAVVLTELLYNAIEHGVPTGGRVIVQAERQDTEFKISVIDDGFPGINEHAQDGLGLQIVRTLVADELRGRVTFERSENNSGTAVVIVLSEQD